MVQPRKSCGLDNRTRIKLSLTPSWRTITIGLNFQASKLDVDHETDSLTDGEWLPHDLRRPFNGVNGSEMTVSTE
jgi:hypothetical protein